MALPSQPGSMPRSSIRRGLLAAVLAPPLGAGAYGFVYALFWLPPGGDGAGIFGALLVIPLFAALFGSLLAYPGMLVIGLPAWLLLRRFRAESALTYAACGFLGGFILPPIKRHWSLVGESPLLHNAVAGAFTGLLFWWIARDRRPDTKNSGPTPQSTSNLSPSHKPG